MEEVLGTEETGEAVAGFLVSTAELDTLIDGIGSGNCFLEPNHVGANVGDLLLECGGFVTDLGGR